MQYAVVLQALAVILPAVLAFSTKIFTGKKRFVIAIAVYFILKKWATAAAKDKSLSELVNSNGSVSANGLATLYRQALNPSGYTWAWDTDGTDEDLLFELAARTPSYRAVYDAYKIQYSRDLTNDLQGELSGSDYNKFIGLLG